MPRSAPAASGSWPSRATSWPLPGVPRTDRYGEKLATPDTSVGDLIGDIDPVKVAEGRTLGDPETIHFGLLPRTNRGIFCLNELPDLAERIQVSLLNVLEERDIGVRGYALRLPLDLVLVASANPEDYTNRGRIITPLKDRFGAEIRTHYPLSLEAELALIDQEAELAWDGTDPGAVVPAHLVQVIARFTRLVRASPAVDSRSGVSARFAIAAAEAVAASAVRRAAITGEDQPVARVCDLPAVISTLRGKVEFEVSEEGREQEVLDHLLRRATSDTFRALLGNADLTGLLARFTDGGVVETGDLVPAARPAAPDRRGAGPGEDHGAAADGGRRVARPGGGRAGVRARGPVPDAAAVQGLGRRRGGVPNLTGYRYGPYSGGPDPLEPPYDVRGAVDALGESVLDGTDPASALRDLLRRGMSGHRGLDDLLRRVRERQREIRSRGRLDGILDQVRSLLDTAIGQERAELFPNPADEARMREAELDSLPSDTAQAIRQLADYEWQSAAARETFEQLKSLLRSEVLDSQFRGMRQTLADPDPASHAAGQGHDGRAEQHARRRRPRRAHAAGLRRLHGVLRRHVPRLAGQPGRTGRRPGPADVGRAAPARLADRRAARRAVRADVPGAGGRGPGG